MQLCIQELTLKKVIVLKYTNQKIESRFFETLDFESAFLIQRKFWQLAIDHNQINIMGLDHTAVITLGRRARFNNSKKTDNHIPVLQTTRGGLVTIHSEGQLIIYTIVNLKMHNIGVKDFVLKLLQATQKTFLNFNLETFIDDQTTGLYTKKGKIVFCGLEIKDGVSQHGISINISNDLSLFDQIESCGIQKIKTDKLHHYQSEITLKHFFDVWVQNFSLNELTVS